MTSIWVISSGHLEEAAIILIPGTQMTLVLKGLLLEGSNTNIANIQVPGVHVHVHTFNWFEHPKCIPYLLNNLSTFAVEFVETCGFHDLWDGAKRTYNHP